MELEYYKECREGEYVDYHYNFLWAAQGTLGLCDLIFNTHYLQFKNKETKINAVSKLIKYLRGDETKQFEANELAALQEGGLGDTVLWGFGKENLEAFIAEQQAFSSIKPRA